MCARPAEPGPLSDSRTRTGRRSVQAEAAPARTVGKSASWGGPEGLGRDRPHRPHRRRAKNHSSLPKQTAATARAATQWHDARRPACAVRAQRGEASSGSQSPGPGPPPRPVAPDPGARVRVPGTPARPRRLGYSVPASSVGDGAGPCHEQWPCHRDQPERQPPASPTRPSLPSSRRHCRWLGTRARGAQRHGARKAELPRHICTGCTRTGHICTRTRR